VPQGEGLRAHDRSRHRRCRQREPRLDRLPLRLQGSAAHEAITRTCEEWTARLGQAAFASGSESPLEQMGASWVAMLSSFEGLRPVLIGLVEAVGQSAWSEDLRQELAAHYRTSREQVAAMVRASLGEESEDTSTDADVVASFLIAVCDGLVLQWLLNPEEYPHKAISSSRRSARPLLAPYRRHRSQPHSDSGLGRQRHARDRMGRPSLSRRPLPIPGTV